MFDSRTFQATFNAQWKRRNLMASRMWPKFSCTNSWVRTCVCHLLQIFLN